jgi:hypothetical protein
MGHDTCVSQSQLLIFGYSLIKKGETEEQGRSIPYTLSPFSGYNFSAKYNAPYQ